VVFDSVLSPGKALFANDRPLIPVRRIINALNEVEQSGSRIANQTGAIVDRLAGQTWTIDKIAKLQIPIAPVIQRELTGTWRSGWDLGASHCRQEIIAGIPRSVRADSAQFQLDENTLRLIATFLDGESGLLIPLSVEEAIKQRVLTIAGNYSKAIIDRIKADLIASVIPTDGKTIDRRELQTRLQNTLNIGRARAETIARNEATTAYNDARVRVMRESSIVTHVRFLAIGDSRTTEICRSRNGMLIPISETGTIAANSPALHHRCRSLLSPVMGTINQTHAEWVADPDRSWLNRSLAPLPKGWKT
jgi:SPP1 gp7 family putative phage head morphogenesis protein